MKHKKKKQIKVITSKVIKEITSAMLCFYFSVKFGLVIIYVLIGYHK